MCVCVCVRACMRVCVRICEFMEGFVYVVSAYSNRLSR